MLAEKLGIKEKDVKQLCANPQITKFILDELTKQGKNDGLISFEQAKKIRLWHEPFQIQELLWSLAAWLPLAAVVYHPWLVPLGPLVLTLESSCGFPVYSIDAN